MLAFSWPSGYLSVFLKSGSFSRIRTISLTDLRDRGAHSSCVSADESKSGIFRASAKSLDILMKDGPRDGGTPHLL
jgi:hypothetical protein